jgi:hypothetical protein
MKGIMLSNMGILFRHFMCEYVFNVGITIDKCYSSELYSNYSSFYDQFDKKNVVNNQTFMGMLVLGAIFLHRVFLWHT